MSHPIDTATSSRAETPAHRSWIAFPIALALVALIAFGSVSNPVIGDLAYPIAQPGL